MNPSTQKAESHAPFRCLVIQLARLGDTLQSLMALRAAKQLYPQMEITFLARERFSSAAARVSWIKEVITLPTDTLLGPVIKGERDESQALGDIARWIAPLVRDPWDMVVNWSYSESSSYLTALIPSRVKLGYTRRIDSTFSGADGWSHYIQAIVQGCVNQNIHLTDILTTQLLTALQIHVGDPLPNGNAPVTSKGFFSLQLREADLLSPFEALGNTSGSAAGNASRKWICFQLGAGKKEKTWHPALWAKLADLVLQKNPEYGIVLLGGKEDKEREKTFLDSLTPSQNVSQKVVSLVGETSFDLWASVVSRSQWLFSGDTAAIHLASVLGTRILNISIGPVRHSETGPYGNGHYVVKPAMDCPACSSASKQEKHTCSEAVAPQAIYSTWTYASQEWAHNRQVSLEQHFLEVGGLPALEGIQVYRSRIRNTQDGGGVLYEALTKKFLGINEWVGMVMGQVARSWYCGWVPPVGQELSRDTLGPALIQKVRQLQDSTEVLSKICSQASQTASRLTRKSTILKSDKIMGIQDRQEIQELGKALGELESLVDRLVKTHPPLLAFSQMAKVLMHNLKGSHLADLGKETAECYRQLNEGVQIFKDWIRFTLGLIKPISIKPAVISALEPKTKPGKDLTP